MCNTCARRPCWPTPSPLTRRIPLCGMRALTRPCLHAPSLAHLPHFHGLLPAPLRVLRCTCSCPSRYTTHGLTHHLCPTVVVTIMSRLSHAPREFHPFERPGHGMWPTEPRSATVVHVSAAACGPHPTAARPHCTQTHSTHKHTHTHERARTNTHAYARAQMGTHTYIRAHTHIFPHTFVGSWPPYMSTRVAEGAITRDASLTHGSSGSDTCSHACVQTRGGGVRVGCIMASAGRAAKMSLPGRTRLQGLLCAQAHVCDHICMRTLRRRTPTPPHTKLASPRPTMMPPAVLLVTMVVLSSVKEAC